MKKYNILVVEEVLQINEAGDKSLVTEQIFFKNFYTRFFANRFYKKYELKKFQTIYMTKYVEGLKANVFIKQRTMHGETYNKESCENAE